MNEYDLDRKQAILSTGDNASEWMEAGADPDELIKLGLLDSDGDDYPIAEGGSDQPEQEQSENNLQTGDEADSDIDWSEEF
jgi:hypothetical protein